MTAENKKVVKILAVSVGIILILTAVTILIVKQVQKSRDAREALKNSNNDSKGTNPAPAKTGSNASGSTSTNTFGGRTFTKAEIEKMQSFLFNTGAMALNEVIVSSIRDTGGIDGKIGAGFKTAYNEAVRIGMIKGLDDLYIKAMKF